MPTYKIIIDFSRVSDADLDQKAEAIIASLTGNANFTSPTPTLAVVTAATDAYKKALSKALIGTENDTRAKNQKRDALVALLQQLGYYVQMNGKNDPVVLGSSGFDLQKTRSRAGVLEKPENLRVTPQTGGVKLAVNPVSGARSYLFEFAPTPVADDTLWHSHASSSSRTSVMGLVSGKQYVFRVCAIGSDPTRTYSDHIVSFVL
jgi:hypothetical protein